MPSNGGMSHKSACIALALACAALLPAQDNVVTTESKGFYELVKNNIIKAADKMPAEQYAFKPTPEVRTFGGVVAHIADAQYLFCAQIKGEEKKSDVEHGPQTKAAIVEALKAAFAYCDGAYVGMTDVAIVQKAKGGRRTNITLLSFNTAHNNEHYGNLVTYMRLKGIVPPSSEAR